MESSLIKERSKLESSGENQFLFKVTAISEERYAKDGIREIHIQRDDTMDFFLDDVDDDIFITAGENFDSMMINRIRENFPDQPTILSVEVIHNPELLEIIRDIDKHIEENIETYLRIVSKFDNCEDNKKLKHFFNIYKEQRLNKKIKKYSFYCFFFLIWLIVDD